ncbi:hypothetical protein [Geobacter sp. AOG2]|uniref:hypothetical protein n=1 Tax=Geobacter sp. AOG2 TaxID=1566347 RepID=UPI001CC338DD|nr:hypothetical protein [Geobacter sp. AOG2]
MTEIDKILAQEEETWRDRTYEEILSLLNNTQCYSIRKGRKNYYLEVDGEQSTNQGEIIVRIECSRVFLFFLWSGKARYFAFSQSLETRSVDKSEYF